MEFIELLQLILGSLFVLFLPGLSWSFLFFKKDDIGFIERISLSFGLSIVLVVIAAYYLNVLLGVDITFLTGSILILLLTCFPLVCNYLKNTDKMDEILKNLKLRE